MGTVRRGRALATILTGVLLGAMLAACGSNDATLATTPVERSIETAIRSERGVQTTVHCPANVPRKAGQKFRCTASLDVGAYPVTVTEKDGAGHVRYSNPSPLITLNVAAVQHAIVSSILTQRHLAATVACPATVLQHAGLRFTCTATVAGRDYPFEVIQTDSAGHVRYTGR